MGLAMSHHHLVEVVEGADMSHRPVHHHIWKNKNRNKDMMQQQPWVAISSRSRNPKWMLFTVVVRRMLTRDSKILDAGDEDQAVLVGGMHR